MDYRNGRVTSASVCKGPASAKSQTGGKGECNIGMTYEELAATWMRRGRLRMNTDTEQQ